MAGTTGNTSAGYFAAMADQLGRLDHAVIDAYAEAVYEAWREGRRVLVFGNGGSAHTASHHVTDYIKTASVRGRPRLNAISLVDNIGLTTALGNDIGYEDTFVYPLEAFGRAGDIAVAISCSGNSPNVVRACEWARANGLRVVALTGFGGGTIGAMADIHINVPSDNYGVIEDLHMSVGHVVAQSLYERVSKAPAEPV